MLKGTTFPLGSNRIGNRGYSVVLEKCTVFLSVDFKLLVLSIAYFMDITLPQLPCGVQKGL